MDDDSLHQTTLDDLQRRVNVSESAVRNLTEAAQRAEARAVGVEIDAVITAAAGGRSFRNERAKAQFAGEMRSLCGGQPSTLSPAFVKAQLDGDFNFVLAPNGDAAPDSAGAQGGSGDRVWRMTDIRQNMPESELAELKKYMKTLARR